MTLDKVTSLFDLKHKTKMNAYYKQLAMLGLALLEDYPINTFAGKEISDELFNDGMEELIKIATKNGSQSCSRVVERINDSICLLREIIISKPSKSTNKSSCSYNN